MEASGLESVEGPEEPMSEPASEDAGSGSASLLGKLRKRREELRQERSIDLDVPGYGGDLVVRYRPLEWSALRGIAAKVDKSKDLRAELYGCVDTLIKACEEVFLRVDNELKQIEPDDDPVRFDSRLAVALGFEAEKARDVVFGVFNNDLAIQVHHNELAEWMQNTTEEVDQEFAGESEGTSS